MHQAVFGLKKPAEAEDADLIPSMLVATIS